MKWSLTLRQRLFKFSQARPLQQGDSATFNAWQEAFLFLDDSSKPEAVKESPESKEQPDGQRKDYCLWYLIHKCTQSKCGRIHGCPRCPECDVVHRPAPLAWHLSNMKKPQKIIPVESSSQHSSYRGGQGRRERSRSPRAKIERDASPPSRDRRR